MTNTTNRASHFQVAQWGWHATRVSVASSDNFRSYNSFTGRASSQLLLLLFFARIAWFSIYKKNPAVVLRKQQGKNRHLETPRISLPELTRLHSNVGQGWRCRLGSCLFAAKAHRVHNRQMIFSSTLNSVVSAIW